MKVTLIKILSQNFMKIWLAFLKSSSIIFFKNYKNPDFLSHDHHISTKHKQNLIVNSEKVLGIWYFLFYKKTRILFGLRCKMHFHMTYFLKFTKKLSILSTRNFLASFIIFFFEDFDRHRLNFWLGTLAKVISSSIEIDNHFLCPILSSGKYESADSFERVFLVRLSVFLGLLFCA